jgi:redox-sensing transcriptional repressor
MKTPIPSATVARLPRYLRCLADMSALTPQCSSEQIAEGAGVTAAQVRKDLSYLGSHGTRGVGYDIEELMSQIKGVLGMTRTYRVIIVGAGNLGSAITKYGGFAAWGFEIVAVVDVDDVKIGSPIDGLTIEPFDSVRTIVPERDVQIGVVATPPDAAQKAADELMAAGIRSILNLAPVILKTRDDVIVRRVDLSTELGILAYHLSSASTDEAS